MLIDHDTAKNLELCGNNTSRRSKNSLFGYARFLGCCTISCYTYNHLNAGVSLLNHVFTPMGSRLLRASILAPTISTSLLWYSLSTALTHLI